MIQRTPGHWLCVNYFLNWCDVGITFARAKVLPLHNNNNNICNPCYPFSVLKEKGEVEIAIFAELYRKLVSQVMRAYR